LGLLLTIRDKSCAIAKGMEQNTLPIVDVMAGSAEGMIKLIGNSNGEARLLNPDELGFLLERSSLEGASFPFILNRSYYHILAFLA
jgi:hypothetical protein